jgi:hypothetical protein
MSGKIGGNYLSFSQRLAADDSSYMILVDECSINITRPPFAFAAKGHKGSDYAGGISSCQLSLLQGG